MTAIQYDQAWLLRRAKQLARRPAVDASMLDADWYDLATDGQLDAWRDIVTRFPDSQYGPPVQLTSTDGGATYALPANSFGHLELYANLNDMTNNPLTPGYDFMEELGLIRIPNNRTRTFPAGPWMRGAQEPGVISAADAPTLQPMSARILIVDRMLVGWASRPASGGDPAFFDAKYQQHLQQVWTELATQYNLQGLAAGMANTAPWFRR
jgi:hypothetical protein